MSEALYICIDCELASRSDEPTRLNEHSLCLRCGSSSVVPVDTLRELATKAKLESEAPPSVDKDHAKRVQAMRTQRKRDSEPLRAFLHAHVASHRHASSTLENALAQWDGWAWHVFYPWSPTSLGGVDDNPVPQHFVVELVQGVKNGLRWVVVLDSEVVEVREYK
jgi:hypothetical protein